MDQEAKTEEIPPIASQPDIIVDPPSIWSRPLAMMLDSLLLGSVGVLLGWAFFDPLSRIGPWGRLIGFPMALAYFGVMNSGVGGGQTIGKHALRLRVVDLTCQPVTLRRSMVRYVILGVPYFLNGLTIPTSRTSFVAEIVLWIVVIAGGGSIIYLYLFNRPDRRSLHDLLVGSLVVRETTTVVHPVPLARRHPVIMATLLGLLSCVAVALWATYGLGSWYAQQMDVVRVVEDRGDVWSASVSSIIYWKDGKTGQEYQVNALLKGKPASLEKVSREIAALVLEQSGEARSREQIRIILVYGYDLGIASFMQRMNTPYSTREWTHPTGG